MRFARVMALVAAAFAPTVARAEWTEASSAHFVVYADESEAQIRRFAEQLERYHAALAMLTNASPEPPSPSNRVTVYVVRSEQDVRKLHGGNNRFLGGFYLPRAGGSLAIVPTVRTNSRDLDQSMSTLLHEYTHHFMLTSSNFPMPRWYAEGAAEFFSAATFPSAGGVVIGRPALHRAAELLVPGFARDVPVSELLDPPKQTPSRRYDAFYGKSWLLFHYLTFDPERKGQLNRYLQGLTKGRSSREAALEAFGDLAVLEHDLDRYLIKRRMMSFDLKPSLVPSGPVSLRRLAAGEAAILPVRIRSERGVDAEQAKALLVEARAVAARHPDDPRVQAALAEAEHDAGNDREAIAAADAALARDPTLAKAYVQKGLAQFRLAEEAADRAAAYRQARVTFAQLNRREPDHPLPLIYFYYSYMRQDLPPTELAFNGLLKASRLAPFDLGLRMTLVSELVRRHRLADARAAARPIALNPHAGPLARAAQRVIARIDAEPQWDGHDFDILTASVADNAEDPGAD
ncbi:hypothetical protein ACFOON_03040 [Novosphingobium piscinae]|uniref:DUF1570 domain-containing protein n=1 Tax=Novosphingobium piscinae TaxID=1507448 RepID=A0A7X1G211_9SPHN|nr:hypothetical protein [Novosphingobium piscinae]MBC2670507.1 hypothetical protein [Novosphingobium piscinae]